MTIYSNIEILEEISEQKILTLKEVKNFLKVSGNNDNDLISQLIKSAIKKAESLSNISIIDKKYSIIFPQLNCKNLLFFPIYKISNIISVFSKNNCNEKELNQSNYCFDIDNQSLLIKNSMINFEKIKIIFEAKLDENSIHFDSLKQSLLMHINLLYKKRLAFLDSRELDIETRISGLYQSFRFFKL
jgi:uncharacterized phiE125 gp8 family phage protein